MGTSDVIEDEVLVRDLRAVHSAITDARSQTLELAVSRRYLMLELRSRGWSFQRIADLLGIAYQSVQEAVSRTEKGMKL